MIYNTLVNRRFVREYDTTADIPESLIDSLLQQTWKVTPSKNNFMPYTVHVLGPNHQKYKELVYLNSLSNEGLSDSIENPLEARYTEHLPNYANMLSCSYLLIFTMRLETDPNPFQKFLIERGHRYEAVDESRLGDLYAMACLEVGLFTSVFNALLLEHGIDSSFIGCFHRDVEKWKDIPFVKRMPIILMHVGKGKVYIDDIKDELQKQDLRPNYDRIVNFIK
jgi:hypothetical protein